MNIWDFAATHPYISLVMVVVIAMLASEMFANLCRVITRQRIPTCSPSTA